MTDWTTRRDFLRAAGLALGGAIVGAACGRGEQGDGGGAADTAAGGTRAAGAAAGGDTSRASVRPIGVQLYTVRTLMEKDVEGTLRAIADAGYREVEFAGYFDREPQRLRATLGELRLAAPSAHHSVDALRKDLDGVLAAAQTLGHRWIVCPFVDEKERTLAGYRRLAGEFNRWGAACRERGLRFAYHNHDFEFENVEGTVPFDLLLAETDPSQVAFELDLFWITKAGRDPLQYFERHQRRFPLWHVKDMREPRGAQEMVAVGEGGIDFKSIFARSEQAGLEHFFVEHDNPADPLASVRMSYDNLRRMLAA